MNQLFTHLALLSGFATLFLSCKAEYACHELAGRWTNREGQILSFEPDGKHSGSSNLGVNLTLCHQLSL
ncbi:MAG: hypothetical protein IPH31_00190 [Lewinellaceae bacterium]|nr:hypothetical protein [Lewinellaceae bacterium]